MTKKDIDKGLKDIQKLVDDAKALLEKAQDKADDMKEEQREAFDNLPEGLQASDNGQVSEARAEALESIYDEISEAFSTLDGLDLEVA